jgi:hypothetical protein
VGRCWTQDPWAALLRAGGAGAGRFSGLGSSTIETATHVGICPTRKSEEEIKQDARAIVNQPQLRRVSNRLLIARDHQGQAKVVVRQNFVRKHPRRDDVNPTELTAQERMYEPNSKIERDIWQRVHITLATSEKASWQP